MDMSKLMHVLSGFVNVCKWICLSYYMDLSSCSLFFLPLPNKIKLKFDQDFKVCWSFRFELKVLKVSNAFRCAFDNIQN